MKRERNPLWSASNAHNEIHWFGFHCLSAATGKSGWTRHLVGHNKKQKPHKKCREREGRPNFVTTRKIVFQPRVADDVTETTFLKRKIIVICKRPFQVLISSPARLFWRKDWLRLIGQREGQTPFTVSFSANGFLWQRRNKKCLILVAFMRG